MSPENGRDGVHDVGESAASMPAEVSIINILNILLRQRWIIVGIATALVALTVVALLLTPRTYTVESSFIIQKRDQPAAAGIAAQLGMDINNTDASQSPAFYATLVTT